MYYFIYSKQQHDRKESAFRSAGQTFIPGKVTVNGKTQIYTSIVKELKPVQQLFGDLKIVLMTDSLAKVHYSEPTSNSLRRSI